MQDQSSSADSVLLLLTHINGFVLHGKVYDDKSHKFSLFKEIMIYQKFCTLCSDTMLKA